MNTFILFRENFNATELYFRVQSNGSGERHIIKTTMINEMQLSRKKVLQCMKKLIKYEVNFPANIRLKIS